MVIKSSRVLAIISSAIGIFLVVGASTSHLWLLGSHISNFSQSPYVYNDDAASSEYEGAGFVGPFGGCVYSTLTEPKDWKNAELFCVDGLESFLTYLICTAYGNNDVDDNFNRDDGTFDDPSNDNANNDNFQGRFLSVEKTATSCKSSTLWLGDFPDPMIRGTQAALMVGLVLGVVSVVLQVLIWWRGFGGLSVATPFLRLDFWNVIFLGVASALSFGAVTAFQRSPFISTLLHYVTIYWGPAVPSHAITTSHAAGACFAIAAGLLVATGDVSESGTAQQDVSHKSRKILVVLLGIVAASLGIVTAATPHRSSNIVQPIVDTDVLAFRVSLGMYQGCYSEFDESVDPTKGFEISTHQICKKLEELAKVAFCGSVVDIHIGPDSGDDDSQQSCVDSDVYQAISENFPDPSLEAARAFTILGILISFTIVALPFIPLPKFIPKNALLVTLAAAGAAMFGSVTTAIISSPYFSSMMDNLTFESVYTTTSITLTQPGVGADAAIGASVSLAAVAIIVALFPEEEERQQQRLADQEVTTTYNELGNS